MILIQNRYRTGSCFLGEGEAVLEPVDDERGGAPRRPRRRAEQERVQQRVSGPQAGAVVTALSANMPLLQHTNEGAHFDTYHDILLPRHKGRWDDCHPAHVCANYLK